MQSSRPTAAPVQMSPAVVEFLKRPLACHLATVNPGGSPQLTVMWFRYEEGNLLFTTTTTRVKFRNYEHDPRAAVTIIDPHDMWKWVIVNGTFSVDQRDPRAFYVDLARHYHGPEAFEKWQQTAAMENRTVLRLTPRRVRSIGFPVE